MVSGDTLSTIAQGLAATVTDDPNLQSLGINATASGSVISLRSVSPNVTTCTTTNGTTETLSLGNNSSVENITIGGTGSGKTISITVHDASLSGGYQTINYLTTSGQTAAQIAAGLVGPSYLGSLPSAFTVTQVGGSSSPVISIQSTTPNVTSYTDTISPSGGTETVATGTVLNGGQTFLIGGTATNGDKLTLTVQDGGLAAPEAPYYTVVTGNSTTTMANLLAAAINADTNLQNIGVLASNSGPIVTVTSSSINATTYTPGITTTSTFPTETITTGLPPNGTVTAAIGGTPSQYDQVTITVYDATISGGSQAVYYTVGASDTLNNIATNLAANIGTALSTKGITAAATTSATMAFNPVINITSTSQNTTTYTQAIGGTGSHTETIALSSTVGVTQSTYNSVNELTGLSAGGVGNFRGTTDRPVQPVTMNSGALTATMLSSKSFLANPVLSSGINAETVTATPGGGSSYSTTNAYQIGVIGPVSSSLTYDADGNMTSDGTNSYAYDAENRLVLITYPGTGNNSAFTYDPFGRCVEIVENGTSPSFSNPATMQFIWSGSSQCEARDGSGNLLAQYFAMGEIQSGTSYFYTADHLGSIREMTNSSGTVELAQTYDPYGRVTQIQPGGSSYASFGYAGYYVHQRSGLNLTATRA